jgi:hypothetical protein
VRSTGKEGWVVGKVTAVHPGGYGTTGDAANTTYDIAPNSPQNEQLPELMTSWLPLADQKEEKVHAYRIRKHDCEGGGGGGGPVTFLPLGGDSGSGSAVRGVGSSMSLNSDGGNLSVQMLVAEETPQGDETEMTFSFMVVVAVLWIGSGAVVAINCRQLAVVFDLIGAVFGSFEVFMYPGFFW